MPILLYQRNPPRFLEHSRTESNLSASSPNSLLRFFIKLSKPLHSLLNCLASSQHQFSVISQDLMGSINQEKIQRYEEFVDRRLKPDLVRATAERDKVFAQQKIFSDLKKNIENLEKNSVTSLKTLVNIGSEVYAQADVPDTRHIFVDVGLGFFVEFTWSEAIIYIKAREEKIEREIEEYTRLIASIKAQIKLVCEGIRELLELPAERNH